jgi:hypothetical protein
MSNKIFIMNHTNFCISNKMREGFRIFSALLLALVISMNTIAQQDSANIKREKQLKNVAKLNVTSWILYSNGVQLAYERLLSNHTSVTLFGGYIQFPMPSVIDNSPLNFDKDKVKSGYTIGSEFRFYLAKENKYDVPHGVYLAPFISFYHFNNQRNGHDSTNQDNLSLNTTFDFLNIGGELGYQFVIKKRFTVDCVLFGPAISSYYFSMKLNGSTSGDYSEQVQAILDAIKQKYPLLKDLTNGEKLSTSGVSNFWSLGFRYVIQIGYRF